MKKWGKSNVNDHLQGATMFAAIMLPLSLAGSARDTSVA